MCIAGLCSLLQLAGGKQFLDASTYIIRAPCHSAAAHFKIRFYYGILSTTHASPMIVLFVLAMCSSMEV